MRPGHIQRNGFALTYECTLLLSSMLIGSVLLRRTTREMNGDVRFLVLAGRSYAVFQKEYGRIKNIKRQETGLGTQIWCRSAEDKDYRRAKASKT